MHATKILAALAVLAAAGPAASTPPPIVSYGGFLQDSTGAPVTSATTLTFRLYTVPTLGTSYWQESLPVTPNAEGHFTTFLGLSNPLDAAFMGQAYLGIQVAGDGAELTPRIRIGSVPSALSVPWSGITDVPVSSCPASQYASGIDASGRVTCTPLPGQPYSSGWVTFPTADWSFGSGAGAKDFMAPGDLGGSVFFVNGWTGLSAAQSANAAISVYVDDCSYATAPFCRGARQVPFTKSVTGGGQSGVVEFRYAFDTDPNYAIWLDPVVALKSGTWDSAVGGYIRTTYLPSLRWRVVVVPAPAP